MIKRSRLKISNFDLIIIFSILLMVAAIFTRSSFFNLRNLPSILRLSTILGIAALGEALVILSKGIDLSVGAVMGITSVITAMIIKPFGLFPAVIISLIACCIIGLINGLIIVKLKIPSFVATIGMMWVLRGIANYLSDGRLIVIANKSFTKLASSLIVKIIPYFFVGFIIFSLIVFFILTKLNIGRHIYAIGGSEEAAYYSGLNVEKTRIVVYTIAAVLYGIAGLLFASYIRGGSPDLGEGYEFRAITVAAFAGLALSGGKGNILKVIFSAIILIALDSLLTNFAVSPYLQGLFAGSILIATVYYSTRKE